MICASNVTKSFHTADMKAPYVALNQLSCNIPGGCIYGLVGSNGAGKSTFLRLLSGVYRPDSGEITIDEAEQLGREGIISGGMIPKVDCCIEAISKGVKDVTIMDGRVPHAILMELLTDEGAGTMVMKG